MEQLREDLKGILVGLSGRPPYYQSTLSPKVMMGPGTDDPDDLPSQEPVEELVVVEETIQQDNEIL